MKTRKLLGTLIVISFSLGCSLFTILSSNHEPSVQNQNTGVLHNYENEDEDANSAENQEEFEEYEDSGFYILANIPYKTLQLCPPEELNLITDLNVYQTPDLPEPAPRTPFRDPVFGTCMVRVTDRQNDILNPYDTSKGLKNEYARVQSFNADGSLFIVWSIESFWYIYDTESLMPLGELPVYVEPRWDSQNPYLLYYTDETRLMSYDLISGQITEIRDFANDFPGVEIPAVWTRYEGSPTYDSRYWGLIANDAEWNPYAFLIYDTELDNIVVREIPLGYSIDNVTISPLGNYYLASFDDYCEHGNLGNDSNPCGFMVYDSNLENGRSLLRIIGHYDALLDENGREVIVYQDIDTDNISMLDLESGKVTLLFSIDFSHTGIGFHFSGRSLNYPGWGLVSTYNGGFPTDHTWMDDSIFAVEMKEGGRVVRLAHTHSLYDEDIEQDYWAEPHVSVNQDFTKIIFTSNWGRTGTEEVDMYMIILPENWAELLP
jgi:hypothetical protein